MRHVLLVGFMGSGKSTVGRLLAERLGMPFMDLDESIESSTGVTISAIFDSDGEERFRDLETQALSTLAGAPAHVVSCGGGIVLREENRALLRQLGTVVYLQVSSPAALERVGDTSSRPLLQGKQPEEVAQLLKQRETLYATVADVTVATDDMPAEQVARHIEHVLTEGGRE